LKIIYKVKSNKTYHKISVNNSKKLICTSSINFLDQRWRKKMKLPKNPNAEGPLTNLPDYTYMDGRVTPLGVSFKLFQQNSSLQNLLF
jgi:hypothetical protein